MTAHTVKTRVNKHSYIVASHNRRKWWKAI